MARWYVAGGVAKRLLTNDYDPAEDSQDFEVFCAEFHRLSGGSKEQCLEHWKQAQIDVEKDLRSPTFRRQLWQRAHQYQRMLEAP